jgi:hypothetical protein
MRRASLLLTLLLAGCSGDKGAPFDDGKTADAGPTGTIRVAYPAPPYGTTTTATIENFQFLGWRSPATDKYDPAKLVPISLGDYYDPTGASGVRYIVITSTALWCSACKYEYQDMGTGKAATYAQQGVVFLGALFENNDGKPAQPPDLVTWAKAFKVGFPFVLDPALKLGGFFDVDATPMEMIVDAKTMEILVVENGWISSGTESLWSQLDQLLAQ